jgi:hypothetical protein
MSQVINKRGNFLESIEGLEIKQKLIAMLSDTQYNTQASYSSNTELYPDNMMSFVDKHLQYLCAHPKLDADTYLTNLRLMTRVR